MIDKRINYLPNVKMINEMARTNKFLLVKAQWFDIM